MDPIVEFKLHLPNMEPPRRLRRDLGVFELRAMPFKTMVIRYGDAPCAVPTCLSFKARSEGVVGLLLPHPAASQRGLTMDAEPRLLLLANDEPLHVGMWNRGPSDEIKLEPGAPIAQLLFLNLGNVALARPLGGLSLVAGD